MVFYVDLAFEIFTYIIQIGWPLLVQERLASSVEGLTLVHCKMSNEVCHQHISF